MKRLTLASITLLSAALALPHLAHADDDLHVIAAAPGRETVRPMKPDWCEPGHQVDTSCDEKCQRRTIRSANDNDVGSGLDQARGKVASLACDYPDSAYVRQQVAYWRQDWVNATGLTEAEDRAGLKLAADSGERKREQDELCAKVKPTAPNESAQFEQQRVISIALGCEGKFSLAPTGVPWTHMTWMDRPDLPRSQIAAAAFVLACVPDGAGERYANCAGDAATLDRKQLGAELDALGLDALGRVRALELFGVARAKADAALAAIHDNPKLWQVAVTTPREAFDGWNAAVYQPHKALFDLAYAIEDKASAIDPNELSRTPHALGCAPLRKGLREYLASQKPKDKAAVLAATTDAVAYPLLARLALCDAAEGRYTTAEAELQVLRSQHRYRHGARWAAHWAAFDAAIDTNRAVDASAIPQLDNEDADHVIKLALMVADNHTSGRPTSLEEPRGDEGTDRSSVIEQGKVSSVKRTKDGILVTFKKEKWTAASWSCTEGKHIVAFQGGQFIHERDCEPAGTHVETYQLEPRLFDEGSTADHIKVGQVVKCVSAEERAGTATHAFLMEIDAGGGGKKPASAIEYFGVPVRGSR